MTIRRAEEKDTQNVLRMLSQVLEIHARIRPDVFLPGSTKYTRAELEEIFRNENTPVYVAVNQADEAVGYLFCVLREPPFANTMRPRRSFFIDDFCVDETCRGGGIGRALFAFALEEARRLGCDEVTLNVWEGNDAARRFYENLGMKPKETQMEYRLSPTGTEADA